MRKDLKFIRIIRGVLLLVSAVLVLWFVNEYSRAFVKGWNSFDETETLQARFHDAVFNAVISKPGDSLNITGKDGYVFKLEKSEIVTGTVYNLHQDNTRYSIYRAAVVIMGYAMAFFGFKVFSKLYHFLGDSAKGEIFTLKNINRIKDIGLSCVYMSFLSWAGNYTAFLKKKELFRFTAYQMEYNFDFDYTLFAAGMLTLVIMYVFKKGYELQQEHELTI